MTEPRAAAPSAAAPALREALERLRDHGYQPMYNGRPSCPFCGTFVDDEESHRPSCLLVAALADQSQEAAMSGPRTAAGRRLLLDLVEHVEALAPKQSKPIHDATAKAILAIETESAPAGLDVELIATILRTGSIGCEDHRDLQGGYHLASAHREDAEFIAAEYARLQQR
jgi:hypothetical protein